MRKYLWFGLAVVIVASIVSIQSISADIISDPLDVVKPDYGPTEVEPFVTKIINYSVSILELVFIIMLLVGGAMYLTSMGNDEQANKAKKLLLYSVIGIVAVGGAWTIGTWILGRLKG